MLGFQQALPQATLRASPVQVADKGFHCGPVDWRQTCQELSVPRDLVLFLLNLWVGKQQVRKYLYSEVCRTSRLFCIPPRRWHPLSLLSIKLSLALLKGKKLPVPWLSLMPRGEREDSVSDVLGNVQVYEGEGQKHRPR